MTWDVLLFASKLPLYFPVYVMPIPSQKLLLSAGMRSPRISRSRMHHSGQETGTKCQKSPVEAGDVTLGHSGGFFMVLLTGRALAAPSPPILGSSLKGSCQYVPCALSFPPGSVQQSVAVVFPGRRAALQVFSCLSP